MSFVYKSTLAEVLSFRKCLTLVEKLTLGKKYTDLLLVCNWLNTEAEFNSESA